jgi:APA family basic amino acid/polyamine antiporter
VTPDEPVGPTTYARRLGPFDATMVVVGGIVGAGIFLNPAIVAERVGSGGLVMAAWALGGAIALLGALCFAELGARRPEAGGGYVYLRETLGPLPAFLYGWTLLLVINSGGIAAVAVTFARYAADLFGMGPTSVRPLAVGAIAVLTAVNVAGVRPGAWTQNAFTVLKLAAIAVLVVVGVVLAGGDGTVAPGPARVPAAGEGSGGSLLVLGPALIPVLFAYGGWQHANHVAGEVRDPERTLPRALLAGVSIVVATYLLANLAYLRGLGVEGLASSLAPASDTMRSVVGEGGARFIAAGIVVSTFGILNLFILAAPRVYQTMAADGLFFRSVARLHPRHRTPHRALLLQAGWAAALALTGTYGELLDWTVFGDWIFFGAVAATLFVYRRRDPPSPTGERAFRVPLHPLVPGLFVAAALVVVVSSVASNPLNALYGTALIGAGVPVFFLWRSSAGR